MSLNSNSQRAILVDDTDPSLNYGGPWTPSQLNGIFTTVHTVLASTGTASVSVNFSGVSIIAYADTTLANNSVDVVPTPAIPYIVSCAIDGVPVSSTTEIERTLVDLELCLLPQPLPPGTHTLSISWAFPTPNPQFEIDFNYLLVTPAQDQIITGDKNVVFFAADPAVQTSIQQSNSGWFIEGDHVQTSVNGAQFTFQFTGVSIMWFGKQSSSPMSNTTATYTVDGGTPTSFSLVNSTGITLAAQPQLFRTQLFPYGNHTLQVVYQSNDSVPLTLFALIVVRTPALPSSTSASSSSTLPPQLPSSQASLTTSPALTVQSSTTPPLMTAQSSHHGTDAARRGGIAGGVLGFAVLVGLVICFLIFCRRRSRRNRAASVSLAPSEDLSHSDLVPDPFPVSRGPSGQRYSLVASMPYATEELHRTALLGTSAAQSLHTTPDSLQPQPGTLAGFNAEKGTYYDVQREEDSGIRVMQPTTKHPPLYTVN